MIVEGYTWRNPLRNDQAVAERQYALSMSVGTLHPILPAKPSHEAGMAVIGMSGVGKSVSIERVLSFLPPVIRHHVPKGSNASVVWVGSNLQVVWIKIECPPDGSPKHLFLWILHEYDRILGTYYVFEVGKRPTLDELLEKVINVTRYHHTGLIFIDEIQFATNGGGSHGDPLLNYLVTFKNRSRVPILVAGTPNATKIFTYSFRLARRSGDFGSPIFRNMSFDFEWEHFITQLFHFQWIRKPCKLNDALISHIYKLTQGIHALPIRLFQFSQIRSIRSGKEYLSSSLLDEVYDFYFKPIKFIINAIERNDQTIIKKYDDLLASTIAHFEAEIDRVTSISSEKDMHVKTKQQQNCELPAISDLVCMGIPQTIAIKFVGYALLANPRLKGNDLTNTALAMVDFDYIKQARAVPKVQRLRDIVGEAGTTNEKIEALVNAGIVLKSSKS
jgi:hypothetical protein